MAPSTKKLPGHTWEGTAQYYHHRVQNLEEERVDLRFYNKQAFSRGYRVGVAVARAELRDKERDAEARRAGDAATPLRDPSVPGGLEGRRRGGYLVQALGRVFRHGALQGH